MPSGRTQLRRWGQLRLLLLMSVDLPARQRYLLVYCEEAALREQLVRVLDPIQLSAIPLPGGGGEAHGGVGEQVSAFTIGDYSVSRKVLLPILRSGLGGGAKL